MPNGQPPPYYTGLPHGEQLDLENYRSDFGERFWAPINTGWKLERQLTFRELDNASFDAFEAGDWERAVALLDERRPDIERYQQDIFAQGIDFRRVRVVCDPLTPYLIWELTSLMIACEYGAAIRVVNVDTVRHLESDGPLPEIVTFDDTTVYEVLYGTFDDTTAHEALYDSAGLAYGAVRSTNQPTVKHWAEFIGGLYDRGEDLTDFFARELDDRQSALLDLT